MTNQQVFRVVLTRQDQIFEVLYLRNLNRARRRVRMWRQHPGNQAEVRCLGKEVFLLRAPCLGLA